RPPLMERLGCSHKARRAKKAGNLLQLILIHLPRNQLTFLSTLSLGFWKSRLHICVRLATKSSRYCQELFRSPPSILSS
ncbi:hypothetical protein C0992_002115, partial [Termitomyces sp. T32_za158]